MVAMKDEAKPEKPAGKDAKAAREARLAAALRANLRRRKAVDDEPDAVDDRPRGIMSGLSKAE